MTIIKNSKTPENGNLWEDMEKLELLYNVGGNVNGAATLENSMAV